MSKRNQKRIEHELKDLINLRDNSNKCGECDATFPTWASVNLGIFLCGRCASMHKKLGPDVSLVKSLTHDRWDDEDLDSIANWGNKRAKKFWNPKNVPFPYDDDDKDEVYMYFIKKYQRGEFRYDPVVPEDYNLGRTSHSSHSSRSRETSNASRSSYGSVPRLSHRDTPEIKRMKYRKLEPRLQSMGFRNTDDNYEALVLSKGDVQLAAEILSKSDDNNESKPPLPRRPGSSSQGAQPQSSSDWWSGNGAPTGSAETPQSALFDGSSAPGSSASAIPVGPDGLIEPPQQYLDPATGIIYVDPAHQQQYELQQQQLLLQQQQTQQLYGGAVQPQKTGLDKNTLLSLYSQPTAQQQQAALQTQPTAFSQFSGLPQQIGQPVQPVQQQQQYAAPQFNGYQQTQPQQFQGGYQF